MSIVYDFASIKQRMSPTLTADEVAMLSHWFIKTFNYGVIVAGEVFDPENPKPEQIEQIRQIKHQADADPDYFRE